MLSDEARTIELRGRRVQVVGVDPRSYRRGHGAARRLADLDADLRILLCHFPNVIDRLRPGVFDLVLAGHLHAGQICIPYGRGKVRLAHLRWTYAEGLYDGREASCTSRPGSGRPSCRSASSPGRRRPSSSYRSSRVSTRVAGLTGATLQEAPDVCHELRLVAVAERSQRRQAPLDRAGRGGLGRLGRGLPRRRRTVLGSMQYGPAEFFPRAWELPAGPPSDDAVLVTCAYLVDRASPWVMQSLFLAAIGDARDKGAGALETFAYRYPEGETAYERFLVHRTVFPRDFLADFGFLTVRARARSSSRGSSSGGFSRSPRERGRRCCGS